MLAPSHGIVKANNSHGSTQSVLHYAFCIPEDIKGQRAALVAGCRPGAVFELQT
jgi:hypothetical protein